jgi:hydroxymethylpyrimidine/phosphomethylpyrimidine kinase
MKNKSTSKVNYYPSALTVAGSDSSGGAGIQADLRTFNAYAVYGCSAITAVTAQNIFKVSDICCLPAEIVAAQIDTVLESVPLTFGKSGMLGNAEIVRALADSVRKHHLKMVVDPVMISTSGKRLLDEDACQVICDELLKEAYAITPNIPEAELICGRKLTSISDLADSAQMLYEKYKCNCLLKSGHAVLSDTVTDIICYQGKLFALSSPAAEVAKNTAHGTGCTLSAALAANFASGKNFPEALMAAKAFFYGSLCESVNLRDSLAQMYPPAKNHMDQVKLKEL